MRTRKPYNLNLIDVGADTTQMTISRAPWMMNSCVVMMMMMMMMMMMVMMIMIMMIMMIMITIIMLMLIMKVLFVISF